MPRYEQAGAFFWTIEVAGSQITTSLGKIGNAGHARIKDHGTPAAAKREAGRQIAEKLEQGYALVKAAKRRRS